MRIYAPNHKSQGRDKLKPQSETCPHPIEELKLNIVETVEKLELSYCSERKEGRF